ncbi:MAG: hypothetical protein U0984_01280, partial [Prosthecobacter sp.]|nr:hypothetical protein [Prosthecobacter sp.]
MQRQWWWAGAVVLGLPDTPDNAALDFTLGGLDDEGKEFDLNFSLLNPGAPGLGLTNKATFPALNPNKVTMPTITPATGAFSGDFTIPGATAAKNRKATYQGLIVEDADGIQGHGFF